MGRVSGRLVGNPAKGSLAGATVVLLRFGADAAGQPTGGPVGRLLAGPGGAFTFTGVAIDRAARYQLGSRVDGNLIASAPFTFAPGQTEVVMNLAVPDVVGDLSALTIGQVLLAFEPRAGAVWVTEVVHVENPTPNVIFNADTPVELPVAVEAEELEVIRFDPINGGHERVGGNLLAFGRFQPGTNTIAVSYRYPAALGSATLEKRYTQPVEELLVLAPVGTLSVEGAGLTPQPERTVENERYDAWRAAALPAGAAIRLRITGAPIEQAVLLAPLAVFLVVMGGVVIWFLRTRLRGATSQAE